MAKQNPGDKIDLNEVEMVFGTPSSPEDSQRRPDVHSVANERSNGKSGLKSDKADGDAEPLPTAAQPLLEPERPRQRPPLAGPEVDDLDDGDQVKSVNSDGSKPSIHHEGIDDGLLEDTEKPAASPTEADGEGADSDAGAPDHTKTNGDGAPDHDHDDGKWSSHELDETDFYYGDGYIGNGLHNRMGEDRPGSPFPASIPDVNTYQQKKNLAQGMMDLALLSANANQLRYVLESQQSHPYYFPSLVFISCSIILQIAVGVGLILNSRYNVKDEKDICKADKINNMTVLGIFLITIVNVFITSFSVATPAATAAIQQAGSLAGAG